MDILKQIYFKVIPFVVPISVYASNVCFQCIPSQCIFPIYLLYNGRKHLFENARKNKLYMAKITKNSMYIPNVVFYNEKKHLLFLKMQGKYQFFMVKIKKQGFRESMKGFTLTNSLV